MTIPWKEIIVQNLKNSDVVTNYPLEPNIMRLATKRLAGGKQSRALNPILRMPCNKKVSLEKSLTKESVNILPAPLSV